MEEVFTFDKCYQERFNDFQEILSGKDFIPFCAVKKEWAYHLEFAMESSGWQAIWKIPRHKCEQYKIPFPTVVLVVVHRTEFMELLASVRVVGVNDAEISIPRKHYVPLWQLWPMKEQDNSIVLDIQSTAETLDKLRFFYIHLVMPWDRDESDTVDWKANHLENRLRLYYDLKNKVIPKPASEHVYALLNEARRLQTKRESLERILGPFIDLDVIEQANPEYQQQFDELLEINVRIIQIKSEIEMFEVPVYRKVVLKKMKIGEDCFLCTEPRIWLVFSKAPAYSHIAYLQTVSDMYPNAPLTFARDLKGQIEATNKDDVLIVGAGEHPIENIHVFVENWTLVGLGNRTDVGIVSTTEGVVMDFVLALGTIENVTILAKAAQCAILVRSGIALIRNCRIIGSNNSSTHQAIIVLNGAELKLIDCEILDFSTGIVGNSGAKITVQNCDVHDMNYGFKIHEGCSLEMEDVRISNCKEFGMMLETTEITEGRQIVERFETSVEILKLTPNVKAVQLSGGNNVGDIAVHQKANFKAVPDLFADTELDPTLRDSSDGEWDSDLGELVAYAPEQAANGQT